MDFPNFILNVISIIIGGTSVALFISNLIFQALLFFIMFIIFDYIAELRNKTIKIKQGG